MRNAFVALAFFLFFLCAPGFAQNAAAIPGQASPRGITNPQYGKHRNQVDPTEEKLERDQEKRRNKDRQATLQRDTDKLLALATELKQYVDKTNENILSVDVVKKAEEIEKLAHQVKEKMREAH